MRQGILLAFLLLAGCGSLHGTSDPAASLAGLRLEVPCSDAKFGGDTECHWDPALLQTADPAWKLKREIARTFAGQAGVLYDVTLRVRGVVEPKNFTGGEVRFDHFQTGGAAIRNDYNFYSLAVSEPAATYTFNRHADQVGHYTFPIDYQVTIPVRGGARLTMGAYDSNDVAIANHRHFVVDGVAPAPGFFDGQFFQLDVISVRKHE
jgi:hypothetical protein